MTTAKQERGHRLLDKIDLGDIEAVKRDLNYDVDLTVERRGETPIHMAARKGHVEVLELLVGCGGDVNIRNSNLFTPLHYAVREGNIDVARLLHSCGADINARNQEGTAPIHELVKHQGVDSIEDMVALGMDINIKNVAGETPLHTACVYERYEVAEFLLALGANAAIRNKDGRTAVELCKDKNLYERFKRFCLIRNQLGVRVMEIQGITLQEEKEGQRSQSIYLNRVGILLENLSFQKSFTVNQTQRKSENIQNPNDSTTQSNSVETQSSDESPTIPLTSKSSRVHIYCKREDILYTQTKLSTEVGDEPLSDIYHIHSTGPARFCSVTISVQTFEEPSQNEEVFVRYEDKSTNHRGSVTKRNETYMYTFKETLSPDTRSIFGIFTRARAHPTVVENKGMVVKSPALENFRLDVRPGTFDKKTTITVQIFPAVTSPQAGLLSHSFSNDSICVFTDLVKITSSCKDLKKPVTMTLPTVGNPVSAKGLTFLCSDENSVQESDALEPMEGVIKVDSTTVSIALPHFSLYVMVSKSMWNDDIKEIHRWLVAMYERRQYGVFFVMVKYGHGMKTPSLLLECCKAERRAKRIAHWKERGFASQKPEASTMFLLAPCEEFIVRFKGVSPENCADDVKLVFLPRRSTFQVFKLPFRDRRRTVVKGTVVIQKETADLSETMAILPFEANASMRKYRGLRKDFLLPDYLA